MSIIHLEDINTRLQEASFLIYFFLSVIWLPLTCLVSAEHQGQAHLGNGQPWDCSALRAGRERRPPPEPKLQGVLTHTLYPTWAEAASFVPKQRRPAQQWPPKPPAAPPAPPHTSHTQRPLRPRPTQRPALRATQNPLSHTQTPFPHVPGWKHQEDVWKNGKWEKSIFNYHRQKLI